MTIPSKIIISTIYKYLVTIILITPDDKINMIRYSTVEYEIRDIDSKFRSPSERNIIMRQTH